MQNALDRHRPASNLPAPAPQRDSAQADPSEEAPFRERASRAIADLYQWLTRTRDSRQAGLQSELLDQHTLNDIGVTRFEIVYWRKTDSGKK